MSNSVSHSIFHQTLIYQSKVVNSCGNRLGSKNKFLLSTNFRGNRFCVKKLKEKHQQHRFVNPCAVLTSNAASEDVCYLFNNAVLDSLVNILSGKFNLEGNLELQVVVNSSAPVAARQVDIQVSNSSGSLVLHWGVVHDRQGWVLPSRSPDGTKVYKNRALRTPFVKSGSGSFLKIEVDDPAAKAIEFLILDESQNKWFKNNGENFHIKLPVKDRLAQQVSVPEDLVQVQAYIRWERKGKQIYTPEQEKEEYEAARRELLEEVTRGTSVQDLRARLTNKTNATEVKEPTVYEPKTIPDELVQIQAFIRWEKAGKPNYSPEQQLMEFEEARKDLLSELEKGASVDEIRKKITKGEIQTKVAKQLNTKEYFNVQRIQRKKRDLTKLINRNVVENIVEQYIESSKTLTIIESYAKAREEYDGSLVLNKKIHKLADGDLLVLVTKDDDKTNIHLATDSKVPVTFHWALTRTPGGGEWLVPPANALPPGSVTMEGAAETPFKAGSSSHLSYEVQTLDIEVKDDTFKGIPFVILSGGKWIKNNGSNFIIEFGGKKQIQKDFGDAKGTAKGLLDKIAEMESEAQKSFMHRFNIASDLIDEAKNAGQLGLAGILVWMRFMATRQLIWNKNYNVKPREISKAQDRLTDLLQDVYTSYPQYRELVRMIMSTVGRGGEGDVGQRIRDEILVIQRNNDLGGMMEEWHQKLHNNTSPDDVVICQALIDYINSDFDIGVYWKTLNDNGITKERLLSYDRAIHSEPNFGRDQKEGLLRDLGNYMKTLKAVHSGADLESAITNCKGYKAEGLLEARQELQPSLKMSQSRLKDLLFLDVALDSTVRTAVERGYEQLNNAGPEKIMYFISMVLENLALSSDDNEDLIYCLKRNNDLGGMMEEWHQKLHNNTSPDDVVICQALIDYINSDFDIGVYWKTLNDNGITKERLLSYDRAIHSEPNFGRDQKEGLLRDLGNYMKTLKAVHSGADLESAITNCKGYKAEGQGFMVGVNINPVSGLPSGFPELLQFVMENIEDKNAEPLLEGLLEARQELQPSLKMSQSRLKDLLFLDVALDSTVRTAVERGYEQLNNAGPEKIMYFISMVLENLALSSDDNEDLIYCLKGWDIALSMCKSKDTHWALYAKSVLDRTRLALTNKAELYQQILQPSAEYLGSLLGVDRWAIEIFTEEMIRAGSAASLSTLLNRLDPVLRKTANLGSCFDSDNLLMQFWMAWNSWQVISPVETIGYVEVVDELLTVQNKSYERPTILVAKRVKGEEEIPDGAVAVLTPDMPDVLSHVSVRARNSKVCFATCFDPNILAELQANKGKLLRLKPTSADVVYSEVKESEFIDDKSTHLQEFGSGSPISLVKKQFSGRYAVSSEEFTVEMVGAKSRNISYLKGKVPSWVGIPTSVALPFGVFEHVLSDKSNQAIAEKVNVLKKKLTEGDFSALKEIRETVLQLNAPSQLVEELKVKMKSSGMPWPGDDGEQRWEQAWKAIKKVWGSKWNERAYFSTRKVKLDHDYLSMSVLVQEVINADYAFVIHTTNPSSGDSSEIYAEVVKGLGETLVGAYPGRALSFICKKHDLNSPRVLGYPSKPIGLFIRRSIIFRSDSNGEDLEGYAGAGLYDSVPMDEEDKVVLDYSSDQLIIDGNFRQSILSSIAGAGNAIEELYGSPQDIEGVIRDGKVYVVQTRPQM
ncbi:hypothetical protein TanjilG_13859 [Lupinus angustifolius]|uniref:Uncharacterized protein n=1 Tax=Lupinus angustifolius TaxID=3871 RepID=A0A1J7GW79_LUPAN|nr:hypothetical protein TanjilG_13859 [Lupinus angustifolius]